MPAFHALCKPVRLADLKPPLAHIASSEAPFHKTLSFKLAQIHLAETRHSSDKFSLMHDCKWQFISTFSSMVISFAMDDVCVRSKPPFLCA